MKNLASKISAYKEALDGLPSEKTDNYESLVRTILIARDRVNHGLKNVSHDDKIYAHVVEQDKRLKEAGKVIVDTIGRNGFVDWREANQPPDTAWWWFLDERIAKNDEKAKEAAQKSAAFWIILTVLCVSGSIHLTADITRRFIGTEGDWATTINALLQAPLTVLNAGLGVLALGTLTDPGREWAEKLLTSVGLFKKYSFKKRFVVAAAIFILVLCCRLSLPAVAHFYVRRGLRFAEQGEQPSAVINFQRAISLDPSNANAHYNLAVMYETQNDDKNTDKAINEYNIALHYDSGLLEARSNLARLYIRDAKDEHDLNQVLQNLTNAINFSPQAWDVRYALYKNRGLAHLRLNHHPEAEADLREAIKIDQNRPGRQDSLNDRVAPHCLLGHVLYAQHREAEAMEEWDTCVRYHCSDEDIEPEWVREAQEHTKIVGDCVQ